MPRFLALLVSLLAIFAFSSPLMAQTAETGALTGTITDTSGAVVPNVKITATNPGTGQERSVVSAGDGSYNIGLLNPGVYRVKFEAAGFQTIEVPSVTITVTETGTLNRVLTVGAQSQEVTIQADVETVQTSNAAVGAVMDSATVVDLPLTTRNYQNLIGFSPGANASVPDATSLGKATVSTAVNGSTTSQNNFQLDGVSVNNFLSFGAGAEGGFYGAQGIPDPDSIAEFKIQTSTYDAGYGRNPGANVNVVTKAGGNDFHGTAFEFFRNTVLNANTFFFNEDGSPRGALDQNQYGGVFGGPIKKDKLFFFVSYQQTWQKNGIASTGASTTFLPPIPTGDRGTCSPPTWTDAATACNATAQTFIHMLGAAVCPANHSPGGIINPFDQIQTPGSITVACDGSNINPVAINILQLKLPNGQYYLPSGVPDPLDKTYQLQTYSQPAYYHEYQGMGNWDYVINSKNTLSGRYFFGTDPITAAFAGGTAVPGSGYTSQYTNHEALLRLTTIVTNNLVNEARISYQRNQSQLSSSAPFTATQVGMASNAPALPVLPLFQIQGVFTFGSDGFDIYYQGVNQFQWADQMSWIHGKHSVRFGVEAERIQADNEVVGLAVGQPVVNSFPDFLIGRCGNVPGCALSNGSPSSNIFEPDEFHTTNQVADGGEWPHYFRATDVSAFIQDDFKISPRLTVNLGLRWEYDGFPSEINGAFSSINPDLVQAAGFPGSTFATGSLAGFVVPHNAIEFLPQGVTRGLTNTASLNTAPFDNFAPRVGVAWQPLPHSNRLVMRAGAGYFYDRSAFASQQVLYNTQPFQISNNASPLATLQMPLVAPQTIAAPPGIGFTPRFVDFGPTPNLTNAADSNIANPSVPPHWMVPTQYEWNVDLQYEFAKDWVFQLGYVGSRGLHEPYTASLGIGGDQSVTYYNTAQIATPTHPVNCGYDGNPADCITNTTAANAPNRVPYLGISPTADLQGTDGDYKFNSLQASVRKTFSRGLQVQASYTYSRSFATQDYGIASRSGTVACCLQNGLYGGGSVYGINPVYRPNRFVVNYHYELPFGHHEGITGKFVNGWSVSGVTTIQDGSPLILNSFFGGAAYGGVANSFIVTPQYCPGFGPGTVQTTGSLYSRVVGTKGYLNPAAVNPFAPGCGTPPPPGVTDPSATGFGDVGIGNGLGPGQDSWDITLAKLTTVGGIRENATLEFRTEFFNAFNHPQFGNPSLFAGIGGYGVISTTVVNPRLVQFALKYSF